MRYKLKEGRMGWYMQPDKFKRIVWVEVVLMTIILIGFGKMAVDMFGGRWQ